MANYNSGKSYNLIVPDGGVLYNSGFYTIVISDAGNGIDSLSLIVASIFIIDTGVGVDAASILATLSTIADTGAGNDTIALVANAIISDAGICSDNILSIFAYVTSADSGIGQDLVGNITVINFLITSDGILQPLGVQVLGDSRKDLFPELKEYTDSVPGRHGEIYFNSNLRGKFLELHVLSDEGLTPEQKEIKKRFYAKYLDATKGEKSLVFEDDPDKAYQVKYAGKLDIIPHPMSFEFTIPFKMSSPYLIGNTENTQSGNGTLANSGNVETPLIISIVGALTNPSIVLGSFTLTYSGVISAGQTLIIDTENMTVKLDGVNVIQNYTGEFPMLQPGNTSVTASNQITFIFRDRWI